MVSPASPTPQDRLKTGQNELKLYRYLSYTIKGYLQLVYKKIIHFVAHLYSIL